MKLETEGKKLKGFETESEDLVITIKAECSGEEWSGRLLYDKRTLLYGAEMVGHQLRVLGESLTRTLLKNRVIATQEKEGL